MTAGNQPGPIPSPHHSKPGKTPSMARQMAARLYASQGAVAELMALCHSHVRRLLPLRLTPRHRICRGFTTSSPWCFRRPDTSFTTNASPPHTEQWAHWVMSRICQSGMLELPLTIFLLQEAISCRSRHSIIMFIWKHFQCVSENTLGVCSNLYHLYLTCLLVVISLVCPLCSLSSQMDMTCFDCKWNLFLCTGGHGQRNWQCWALQQQ